MASQLGRSLYVGLKADTKGFGKSLSKAEKQMHMFKNAAKVAGAAVAASFAAMGAAALLFGKSAVSAALEDQKSQMMLARTIKNNTKARKGLNKEAEKTIDTLMYEFNIADDKLRPAMGKLVIATKSVSKSQKLMRLALDVSAGTGKSLDVVVGALSRAYLGNKTALGKLGIGIDKAKLKTMTFEQITTTLSKTMKGSAKDAANTYAGSVEGLKIAWSEFQESVGYKILPKLKMLLDYIKTDLMPWLEQVRDGFNGTQSETISPKLRAVGKALGFEPGKSAAYGLGESLKKMSDAMTLLFASLSSSKAGSAGSSLDQIATSLTTLADSLTRVTKALTDFNGASGFEKLKRFGKYTVSQTPMALLNNVIKNAVGSRFSTSTQASGGPVRGGRPYLVGENGPEMFVPSGAGGIRTASQTRGMLGGTVINLNGIIDADSARRSIEYVLQNSGKRLGAINLTGSAL